MNRPGNIKYWIFATALSTCAAASAASYPGHPVTTPQITAADLSARDKAIADDAFEGRWPGSVTGEAAAQWIADEMKRIGLQPGNHGSYFQTVPAVNIELDPAKSKLVINTKSGAVTPKYLDDAVYVTPRYASDTVDIAKAPLVFVGYGVVAPEYHWDDYAGLDVKGKTVVILVNDPGNEDAKPDPKFFKGKAMTYYGRWTYKYEEAARHGAAAAIIVHETIPAAYGWDVVRSSWSGAQLLLEAKDKNASMLPLEGWITHDMAQDLFRARRPGLRERETGRQPAGFSSRGAGGRNAERASSSHIAHRSSRNVVGVIRGTSAARRLFPLHRPLGPSGRQARRAGADRIHNGAVDNAMGVAGILEIAEAMVACPRPSVRWRSCPGRWKSRACWARNILPRIRSGRSTISWAASISMAGCRKGAPTTWSRRQRRLGAGDPAGRGAENARARDLARSRTGKRLFLSLRPYQPGQAGRADARSRRRL